LDSPLVYTGLQIRAERTDRIAVDVRFEGIPESLQDQFVKLSRVAAGCSFAECPDEVWMARQKLFANAGNSAICKCTALPAQMGLICDAVFRQAQSAEGTATLVVQGTGVAEVRVDTPRPQLQMELIKALRGELGRLEGTLIVQQCPQSLKEGLDIWGTLKDALPLMQSIKQKFDPARTLNPGRFVGAI
jgi:glycolate dehydrogenase FAD-binding subunit